MFIRNPKRKKPSYVKGEIKLKNDIFSPLNRREFLKSSLAGLVSLPVLDFSALAGLNQSQKTKIALVKTSDRKLGVKKSLNLLDFPSPKNKKVIIKPNFNTSDPAPGSTHNDTLSQIILEFRQRGAAEITVGERSGPPPTKKVMEEKGIFDLAKALDFKIINYEELPNEEWIHFSPPGNHWSEGFYLAKAAVEAEYLISTCCLKTHQYGGVFTMSLKLAVGLTPKRLMRELHSSPHQRRMIAELNVGYKPQVIVLDGVEAFVDGGPSIGRRAQADVFIAGTDRIAVDAVSLAVLKELGSNEAIMKTRIFDQEQIQRACELELGITRAEQIEIITPDEPSREYARKVEEILRQG